MEIKREGQVTFIPVVIVLESESEVQVLLRAAQEGFDNSPSDSREEHILRVLRDQLALV